MLLRKAAAPALAATVFAGIALAGCVSPSDAPTPAPATVTVTVTAPATAPAYVPCPQEDYEGPVPCYWDAATRGNGKGHSYIWDGNRVTRTS